MGIRPRDLFHVPIWYLLGRVHLQGIDRRSLGSSPISGRCPYSGASATRALARRHFGSQEHVASGFWPSFGHDNNGIVTHRLTAFEIRESSDECLFAQNLNLTTDRIAVRFWLCPRDDRSHRTRIGAERGIERHGAETTAAKLCNSGLLCTDFSIAHRGAPLGYPEHSREGYIAAAEQGAGVIECDVTFTKDLELVCRHSQCDLATTNILQTPLAAKCSAPFRPATGIQRASATCCTSDITLAEFKTLCARPDRSNLSAQTLQEFLCHLSPR